MSLTDIRAKYLLYRWFTLLFHLLMQDNGVMRPQGFLLQASTLMQRSR